MKGLWYEKDIGRCDSICLDDTVVRVRTGNTTASGIVRDSSVEKELIKLEDGCNDAYVKVDVAFLDRILADDYTDTDQNGIVSTKTQDIADLKSGDFKLTSCVCDDYKVRVYGNAAVVTARLTMKAQYKGQDVSGAYRLTDTWVKRSGRWQCVATHLSKIAEAK